MCFSLIFCIFFSYGHYYTLKFGYILGLGNKIKIFNRVDPKGCRVPIKWAQGKSPT